MKGTRKRKREPDDKEPPMKMQKVLQDEKQKEVSHVQIDDLVSLLEEGKSVGTIKYVGATRCTVYLLSWNKKLHKNYF